MAKEVQQHEALHFEIDVGIDHDREAIEDAGARRLQIAVFQDEPALNDAGRDGGP